MAIGKTTQEVAPATPRTIVPMTPALAMQSVKKIRSLGESGTRNQAAANRCFDEMGREIEYFKACQGWVALGYKAWTDCIEPEFGMSRSQLYRVLEATENLRAVQDLLTGETVTENQLRPLSRLRTEEEKREVFATAKEESGGENPSKTKLKEVADRLSPRGDKSAAKDDLSSSRPDEPRDVAKARKAGIIPEGVAVKDEGEIEGQAEEPELSPMTEEEYLAGCPARPLLSDAVRKRFDAEALAFRKLTPLRLEFAKAARPISREVQRTVHHIGPWLRRILWLQRTPDPTRWVACDVCNGTGVLEYIGECNGCGGHGYNVRNDA